MVRRHGMAAGFTLLEMLVSLFVVTLILLATLGLFDFNNRVARVQIDVADVQQSIRVAQYDVLRTSRMAGRGGLPLGDAPAGLAVAVRNNVPAGTFVDPGDDAHRVAPGTDVLTVRGVIETPVYRISPGTFAVDANPASPTFGTGSFQVSWEALPTVPLPQDLAPLRRAAADGIPEAMVLTSPVDDAIYAVVELDPDRTDVPAAPGVARIGFRFAGGDFTTAYLALAGGVWNPSLTDAAYAGILEEHRFYVRQLGADPAEARTQLVRARVYPNTDVPYRDDTENWARAIADDVLDVQVALGVDLDDDGTIADAGDAADEWFFNHAGDVPAAMAGNPLLYLRVSTLAITSRRDLRYRAPALDRTEDHAYGSGAGDPLNGTTGRQHRRRALTTVIDLRNFT